MTDNDDLITTAKQDYDRYTQLTGDIAMDNDLKNGKYIKKDNVVERRTAERKNLAQKIYNQYQDVLDLSPGTWEYIRQDFSDE
ncbi:MAG: hypothetical protein OEX08_00230 [Candidatus Nomurabacteria bacterium]|nr:hypothetical protein [Candidatus Nomurabacteria bacterium]